MSEESGWEPGEFGPGSQLSSYRLEEQIGRGGMAVVFRAHDARLDRYVALKLLAPGLAEDDAFRQRFMRESRAAAAVDDPHIIPIYEAGEERGVLFIAMRFVRGGDVRSLLDRTGPLPPERAAELLAQAASALDSAHARGLVHRDVKPGNMLLEASPVPDRPDHVYLSDFGLAKASLAVSGLTATGQFLGTLDYVAPEQVEGRTVDGRTDLYALGCVAFELLTGAPPFRRPDGMAVMYAQVSETPPLLSSRRSGLPGETDAIVNKALAKAPGDRYQSCREFAADLQRVLGTRRAAGAQRPPRQATQVVRADPAIPPKAVPEPTAAANAPNAAAASAMPPTAASDQVPAPASPMPAAALPPIESGDLPSVWFRSPSPVRRPAGSSPSRPPVPEAERTAGMAALSGLSASGAHPQARRRWWRSPVPLAVVAAAALVLGGGGYYLAGHQSRASGQPGKKQNVVPAVALKAPACSTQVAAATPVPKVTPANVLIGGHPFGVSESFDTTYTFATIGDALVMMRNGQGSAPEVIRTYPIPGADKYLALTPDGRYLLAAGNSGAVVISVSAAVHLHASPVVGTLSAPQGSNAVGVVASPDSKYVFVTLQNTTTMAVFNLAEALRSGFGPADFVGFVPLGFQPDGVGVSADGQWLYATSIQRAAGPGPAEGTLSVISLSKAETSPATSVKAVVDAGCGPARVISSGQVVWVTARDSNELIGFSASRLVSDPEHAILAEVPVGANPIGEAVTANGSRVLVADTNLNSKTKASGDVAVIDAAKALSGKPALMGIIPAIGEPRQVTVGEGGTMLFMVNMISGELQAVNVADLP